MYLDPVFNKKKEKRKFYSNKYKSFKYSDSKKKKKNNDNKILFLVY